MNRARSGFIHIVGPALEKSRAAVLLCWWHLLAMIVLQVENAVYYGIRPASSNLLVQLMFHQATIHACAFVLAFAATHFLGAVAAGAFISGINFFCVCEQVAFRINGFHTRPSMAEQALNARVSAILLGSFLSELDVVFFGD